MVLRSFLLVLITFLFPLLLFGQEDGEPVKDSTEKKDLSAYKNEVGIGVHSFHLFSGMLFANPKKPYLLFQGSYKRKLNDLTLRTGIGGGKTHVSPSLVYPTDIGDGIGTTTLILNIGFEKAIWRIGERFEMDLALDLVHMNRWGRYYDEWHGRRDIGFRTFGIGLTWGNTLMIGHRSSLSFEAGMLYGANGMKVDEGYKMPELYFFSSPSGAWPWRFSIYRGVVLSYNYHF